MIRKKIKEFIHEVILDNDDLDLLYWALCSLRSDINWSYYAFDKGNYDRVNGYVKQIDELSNYLESCIYEIKDL